MMKKEATPKIQFRLPTAAERISKRTISLVEALRQFSQTSPLSPAAKAILERSELKKANAKSKR